MVKLFAEYDPDNPQISAKADLVSVRMDEVIHLLAQALSDEEAFEEWRSFEQETGERVFIAMKHTAVGQEKKLILQLDSNGRLVILSTHKDD